MARRTDESGPGIPRVTGLKAAGHKGRVARAQQAAEGADGTVDKIDRALKENSKSRKEGRGSK